MPNLVRIEDFYPYKENILHPFWNFENYGGFTTSGTGTVAFDTTYQYAGNYSLFVRNQAFNTVNEFLFAPNFAPLPYYGLVDDGYFFLSFYMRVDSSYSAYKIPVTINVFKNDDPFHVFSTIISNDASLGFVYDNWNRYAQQFAANAGDMITFEIVIGYDTVTVGAPSTVGVSIDGFKMEFSGGTPLAYPAAYLPAKEVDTGWGRYIDNAFSSGSPYAVSAGVTSVIPNDLGGAFINTHLPSYVSFFYSGITQKFIKGNTGNMGNNSNDVDTFEIKFFAKSTVDYDKLKVFIDVAGTEGIVATETKQLTVTAGTYEVLTTFFTLPITNDFFANGGIPKITATAGNLSIYGMQFTVTRIHKSQ